MFSEGLRIILKVGSLKLLLINLKGKWIRRFGKIASILDKTKSVTGSASHIYGLEIPYTVPMNLSTIYKCFSPLFIITFKSLQCPVSLKPRLNFKYSGNIFGLGYS